MSRFIAEIGSNHNRDQERCLRLIELAAQAGCAAVKLQIFRVEDLFAPEALAANPALRARSAWEFPLELLPAVRARCTELGIALGATPFALWAVDELEPYVDFFKVASYELLWHPLLEACADTGKPLILSTGMATVEEIDRAFAVVEGRLTLLHCVSGYPTPPEQSNLAVIGALRERFGCPVGWSDHTTDPEVVARAVARWQASDVEVHIDLDGEGYEAGEHNWTTQSIGAVIERLRTGEVAAEQEDGSLAREALDGDGVKRPMPVELPDVPWRADPRDGLRPLLEMRRRLVAAPSA